MTSYPSNAAYPAALDPLTPKSMDDGGDFGEILQPKHQATKVTTLATALTTATVLGSTVTTINAIIASLIAVGIMKAS